MNKDNLNGEEELTEEFLDEIEEILYQDNKFNDKNMAERILAILEKKYDL